jgi:hypothetical protein
MTTQPTKPAVNQRLTNMVNGALFGSLALGICVTGVMQQMSYSPTPVQEAFDSSAAEVYCSSAIKAQLRDPDSLRILKTVVRDSKTAALEFTAKNGFGGTNRGIASCHATPNGTGFDTTATLY